MVTQEELDNMSPEEIAELQKQNCPFCKIVSGEIPSSNVFEDDDVICILDINPAKKGHTLVLPKEHVPIMPVCPPAVFKKLFHVAKMVSIGQKKGVLVPNTTLFIANGAVAGQQAAHFLFHVIPREKGDGLDNFDVKANNKFLADHEQMFPSLKKNMNIMMQRHAQREGKSYAKKPTGASSSQQDKTQQASSQQGASAQENPDMTPQEAAEKRKEQIAQVVESNPQIRDLLINNPDEFKRQVLLNDQLKAIFEGVDIDNLSQGLKAIANQEAPAQIQEVKEEKKPEEQKEEQKPQQKATESSPSPTSKRPEVFLGTDPYVQKEKVFAYFNQKPKAKELLMSDLETFKELLAKRPDVQEIFKDVNIDKLSEKLIEAEEAHKND